MGFFSAILMNDTVAVIGTPMMLYLTQQHKINPKPLLITLAFSVTVGSVTSPIGNPQNLLIVMDPKICTPCLAIVQGVRNTKTQREGSMGKRKSYSPEFKAKVALEAIKGEKAAAQIASEYGVHPSQVTKWKNHFLENCYKVFAEGFTKEEQLQKHIEHLYKEIGQLKLERDFLSRKLGLLQTPGRGLKW